LKLTRRKYKSGAVGALLHGTILHGVDYSIELEVYCDGVSDTFGQPRSHSQYQLILQDPFGTPAVAIRRPGSDELVVHPTPGDDPYMTEISNFIDAVSSLQRQTSDTDGFQVEGGPEPHFLSSYADAAKTYEFTWAVRRASEAMTRRRRARACGETQSHSEGGTGLEELRMCHGA